MVCRAWLYAHLAPVNDMEIVVHGAALTCPAFQQLLWAALRALIDLLGVQSFNAAISGDFGLTSKSSSSTESGGLVARHVAWNACNLCTCLA